MDVGWLGKRKEIRVPTHKTTSSKTVFPVLKLLFPIFITPPPLKLNLNLVRPSLPVDGTIHNLLPCRKKTFCREENT